jgi:mannitol-1-phosphate/altronate dehydrogenase
MALTDAQKQIADEVAHLLAESPLDDEIKQTILDGMDRLPEFLIFKLRDALEAEREELKRVALEIDMLLKDQERNWQELEKNQQQAAGKLVDEYAQKIEDQVKLNQIKDGLL